MCVCVCVCVCAYVCFSSARLSWTSCRSGPWDIVDPLVWVGVCVCVCVCVCVRMYVSALQDCRGQAAGPVLGISLAAAVLPLVCVCVLACVFVRVCLFVFPRRLLVRLSSLLLSA